MIPRVWYWRGSSWHPADPSVSAELGGCAGNVGALIGRLVRMGYPAMRRDEGPPDNVRPLGCTYDIDVARARARLVISRLAGHDIIESCGGWYCRRCEAIAYLDRLEGTKTGIDLIGTLVSATCNERNAS